MATILITLVTSIRKVIYLSLAFFDTALGRRNNLFILSYHSIAEDKWRYSIDPEVFKKHMLYLKKHYEFITLKDLERYMQGEKVITKPSVILTIDDGYQDVLQMQDFFAENNISPTLFVLSKPEDPNWKEIGYKNQFLTTEEIRALLKKNWEIGCHSATHANLATLRSVELTEEISNSKEKLEKELKYDIRFFAYPRGKYNKEVVAKVAEAKFSLGLTMDDGVITRHTPHLLIPRVGIDRTHTFDQFKAAFSPSVVSFRKFIKLTPIGRYL